MKKIIASLFLFCGVLGCDTGHPNAAEENTQARHAHTDAIREQTESDQPAENKVPVSNSQQQESLDPEIQKLTATEDTLSDEQVATLLSQKIGSWEGTVVIKGYDGEVQAEFPMSDTTHWLDEGKSIEMQVTEHLPQGDQHYIFTKWYDMEQQRFLLTRSKKGEQVSSKPNAYETFDAASNIYHGVVMEGMPPGTSFTWTSQWISKDSKWIYTGEFRQDNEVQSTRIDTIVRTE